MDKYFLFVDENLLNVVLALIASIILTWIILIISKKVFDFNCPPFIFIIFIIARLAIGGKIKSNDHTIFRSSSIHSVVIEQVEWRRQLYRNRLRNGLTFYSENEVSTGDSIVKKADSNTYLKYEKDYNENYVFIKEYTYYR